MWCSVLLLAVLTAMVAVQGEQYWDTNCPKYCKCKWISSKKTADCSDGHLTTVPSTLSAHIQALDLSRNNIAELPKNIFQSVNLVNIHKLYLRSCGIYVIHKDAFEGLKILIELDLENNFIKKLDANTFRNMDKLRILVLMNNSLETLQEGLLSNLTYLQTVNFSKNNLTHVSAKAFMNDPKIQNIILNDNKLKQMRPLVLGANRTLSMLVLHDNPWTCDCHLKAFRNWTIKNNLYTSPTDCKEPSHLRSRLWNEITAEEFACKPVILEPQVGTSVMLRDNKEKTISCKVYGDPVPAVKWVLNNRIIENDRRLDDKHFTIRENGYETTRWVNLTIRNPRMQDRGELICSATNPGGVEERNVTVTLASGILPGLDGDGDPVLLPLILGIVIGVFLLFVILIFLFYCLWRRKKLPSKSEANRSNGGANLDDTEMEKSLITAINPVTKPPRRCDAPPSVASCGTEMSEINRTLLDSDSVFSPANGADEESHSLEFIESNPKLSREIPLAEYNRTERPYPPDLLSFSARTSQVSPAGSCASTIPDYSRQPAPHGPQSPIHSPIYGTLPSNLFRTLPYSRSHSPFTSPGCVPVQSRQGYVTIPRRPRVPSWSAPTSTLGNEVTEPVYDNLGLRTTADGGSVLSLNKSVEPSPIGMRGRPLPATPIYQQNGLPMYYTPIEEHESPPAPCPAPRPPSVRGGSLQRLPTSPCPQPAPETGSRDSWVSRTGPEGASMGMLTPSEEARMSGSISPAPSSLNGTLGRSPKVPPKPPPKPKKKSVVSGPLFEDEGEDGTEV